MWFIFFCESVCSVAAVEVKLSRIQIYIAHKEQDKAAVAENYKTHFLHALRECFMPQCGSSFTIWLKSAEF